MYHLSEVKFIRRAIPFNRFHPNMRYISYNGEKFACNLRLVIRYALPNFTLSTKNALEHVRFRFIVEDFMTKITIRHLSHIKFVFPNDIGI